MSGESFCTKVLNWVKALWPWKKKSDICKLTDIKSKYVAKIIFEYIKIKRVCEIARGNKSVTNIFKELLQDRKNKQALFEMEVLLQVDILGLNGDKPVKTIFFPKYYDKEAKEFIPKSLSDENILEVCRKFNDCFVKLKNPQAYEKYKNQIDDLENLDRFFIPWDPKQFYKLCQNIINAASLTEHKIQDTNFFYKNENQSNNQHKPIPELKINKEKEKNL